VLDFCCCDKIPNINNLRGGRSTLVHCFSSWPLGSMFLEVICLSLLFYFHCFYSYSRYFCLFACLLICLFEVGSGYTAQNAPLLPIFLPQHPRYWHYRHAQSHAAYSKYVCCDSIDVFLRLERL
jgi:hypothetical protein